VTAQYTLIKKVLDGGRRFCQPTGLTVRPTDLRAQLIDGVIVAAENIHQNQ
jgi:hypothetical protein